MKNRSHVALVSAGVILILLVLVLVVFPQSPRVVNENLLSQCSTPWPPEMPGPNVSQREQFAVLLANPGTSPKLCVGYSSLVNSQVPLQLDASVVALNSTTSTVSISAEPYDLTVPSDNNGISPVGVAYAVFILHLSNSSRGFYVLELPGDCPRLLASGYVVPQVNESDFGVWIQRALSCTGNPQVTPNVTMALAGESSLNVTYPYVG